MSDRQEIWDHLIFWFLFILTNRYRVGDPPMIRNSGQLDHLEVHNTHPDHGREKKWLFLNIPLMKYFNGSISWTYSSSRSIWDSPVRYVLKIHFFIEFGLKMIQFKIQFKTKSKIFIQKNIHSIESRIFNRIIHS